jgi:Transmembrane domain of unknown function (DUF3566)
MADRRADETPLAPRRTLSGPAPSTSPSDGDQGGRRPIGERVSSAVAAAGSAVQSAAGSGQASRSTGERTRTGSAPSRRASGSGSTSAAARPTPRPRGTRKARLRLVHLDPWSVMKTSFLLSIAFGIVTVVAVAVVWSVLGAAGVWDSINQTVSDVMGGDSAQTFDVKNYVGTSRVLGFTMIVAVVDVVLITAISTLGAFLYNLAAALLGGVEVTLAEDER